VSQNDNLSFILIFNKNISVPSNQLLAPKIGDFYSFYWFEGEIFLNSKQTLII